MRANMKNIALALLLLISTPTFANDIPPITIPDTGILYIKEQTLEEMTVVFNTPYTMGMNDKDMAVFEQFVDGLSTITIQFDPKKVKLTLIINIQGYGGRADLMNSVMTAIEEAEKKGIIIKMNVIGPAMSAHAFLTCATKSKVEVNPRGALMFHSLGVLRSILGLSYYKTAGLPDKLIPTATNEGLFNSCLMTNKLSKDQVTALKKGAMLEIVYDAQGNLISVIEDDEDNFTNAIYDAIYNAALILLMFCLYLIALKFVVRELRKSWRE